MSDKADNLDVSKRSYKVPPLNEIQCLNQERKNDKFRSTVKTNLLSLIIFITVYYYNCSILLFVIFVNYVENLQIKIYHWDLCIGKNTLYTHSFRHLLRELGTYPL